MEQQIEIVLNQLFENAEKGNPKKLNIDNALGEVIIKGVEYQIKISLIADKKLWVKEDEVRYSEVVKVHD